MKAWPDFQTFFIFSILAHLADNGLAPKFVQCKVNIYFKRQKKYKHLITLYIVWISYYLLISLTPHKEDRFISSLVSIFILFSGYGIFIMFKNNSLFRTLSPMIIFILILTSLYSNIYWN